MQIKNANISNQHEQANEVMQIFLKKNQPTAIYSRDLENQSLIIALSLQSSEVKTV